MDGDAGGPDPARIRDVAGFVREVDLLRRLAARGTGKARVSLTELARSVDVPRSTVHAYVSGKIHPPSDVFDRIVIALRVPRGAWASWNEAWFRVAAHLHAEKKELVAGAPRQLPLDVGGFAGREQDLAGLDQLLTGSPDTGIALVTGMPGVGKTALAIRWAHRAAASFPDGQLFANLRGFADARPADPADVLFGFLRALGMAERAIPRDADRLAACFRSAVAGRRMVVVLDDASSAEQVRPLLPGTPSCAVVITSRTRLVGLVAREGAVPHQLGPLGTDDAIALIRHTAGPGRVDADPASAAELARVCGRLPLALRIAAAHARVRAGMPLSAIVEELRSADPLAVLDAAVDRETAVRTAIALSYRALEPPAQRVFRLLGLFPVDGIALPALAAATELEPESLVPVIGTLLDMHLLVERTPARYSQHALLHSWARLRCREDDADDVRDSALLRLISHYAGLATEAAQLRHPRPYREKYACVRSGGASFTDAAAAMTWFDVEFTTLATLTRQAAAAGLDALATQLCVALHFEFERHRSAEWLPVSEAALAAARVAGDAAGQVLCLRVLGSAHWSRSDHAEALRHLDEAVRLADELDAPDLRRLVLSDLGRTSISIGRLHDAAEYYRRALDLESARGGVASVANLVVLGDVRWELGDLANAYELQVRAIETATRQGYAAGLQLAESHAGRAGQALGDLERAVEHYRTGLELCRSTGEHADEASVLANLAGALRDLGEHDDALTTARDALGKATRLAMLRTQASARHVLGTVMVELGRVDEARVELDSALNLAIAANHPRGRGDALVALSTVHLRQKAFDEAYAAAGEALAVSEQTGHSLIRADSLLAMAAVEHGRGEFQAARAHAEQARAIHGQAACRLGVERADAVLTSLPSGRR
ncbi:tetratricopeptide repeat protein [Amycolatopsis sp. NPDC048633]|uniref:ATP-binding protein n=1 Tax=Amycolatopsis sp. NPDC048633 TaxID=3157095 RepID=UPI0033F51263